MKKILFFLLTALSCQFSNKLTAQVTFTVETLTTCDNTTISVDVTVNNFSNVTAISFPIVWDPAVLQFVTNSISNTSLHPNLQIPNGILGVNQNQSAAGMVNFSWIDLSPPGVSLPNGAAMFTMQFNVVGSYVPPTNSTAILLTDASFPAEAYQNGSLVPSPALFQAGTVTIADAQDPTFNACPPAVTVMGQVATWTAPTASDNCPGAVAVVQTQGLASGSTFPAGTTTIEYEATDQAGNTATCSFGVTVASTQLRLVVTNDTISCEDTTASVQIRVFNLSNVGGMQFPVTWDTSILTIDGMPMLPPGFPLFGSVNPDSLPVGLARYIWFDFGNSNPVVMNDSLVFTLNFKINDPSVASATVAFGSPSFSTVFVDTNNAVIPNNTIVFENGTIIFDDEPPLLSNCPSNISQPNDTGVCGATVAWTLPTATDDCDMPNLVQTAGLASGSIFPIGTTTVTYEIEDSKGQKDTCTFTVTIIDNQPPTITCPANINVNTDAGLCTAVATYVAPVGTDNCPGSTTAQTAGLASGTAFPIGTTTNTFTVTDNAMLTGSCSFTVTVVDNQPPTITCPANISINTDAGLCTAVATYTAPVGTDNCPGSTTAQTAGLASGTAFPIGTTTNTFTVTDNAMLTGSCSFTVTVVDNQAPTITCPANISVNTDAGLCTAAATYAAPVGTDNCPGSTTAQTAGLASGTAFPIGTTTNTFTVTDNALLTGSCSFTVTVVDNQPPTITCPANIAIPTSPGGCQGTATWTVPTPADNCPNATVMGSAMPGSNFPVGVTMVTYTATDASNLTATCAFTIAVADEEDPELFDCPSNISANTSPDQCDANVTWTAPTAADNCTNPPTLTSTASPGVFPLGTTTVTYTAEDAAGNTATCSFTITVVDNQAPTVTNCPASPQLFSTALGLCEATVTWTPPTATDNCPNLSLTANLMPGAVLPVGDSTVVYTATDASGNLTVCSFVVTVEDNENPEIKDCPTDIAQANDAGLCTAVVTWAAPTAVDNCPGVVLSATHQPGDVFPVGTTTVTYTATDAAGNVDNCAFEVTVQDTELPEIDCPADVTTGTDAGECDAVVTWTAPTGLDNCPGFTVISNYDPGDTLALGTTTVEYMVTDAEGNSASCTFEVTVEDDEDPVFANCPANIAQPNDLDSCNAVVTWVAPTATDNCPGGQVASNFDPGDTFPVGTTTVTYMATDAAGNTVACSFDVVVNDTLAPSLSGCPVNISQTAAANDCTAVVTWAAPQIADNCTGATLTAIPPSGSTFPVGDSTVMLIAVDASGNADTCTFVVTVTDDQAPFLECPGDTIIMVPFGTVDTVLNDFALFSVSDNCGVDTIYYALSGATVDTGSGSVVMSGTSFNLDTTLVTFYAADAMGNVDSCSFNVIVMPSLTIDCPTDQSAQNDPGICGAVLTGIPADAQPPASVQSVFYEITGATTGTGPDDASGTTFQVGTSTVTYYAVSVGNDTISCSFEVVVTDTEDPVFTSCQANQVVVNSPGECGVIFDVPVLPVATDNCPGLTMSYSHPVGSVLPVGNNNIFAQAIDAAGNTALCTVSLLVIDMEAPEVPNCPVNISTVNGPGQCGAVVTWPNIMATDNCVVLATTISHPSGSTFPVGSTPVEFVAVDVAGNTTQCQFMVTVTDAEDPKFLFCPSNITVNTAPDECEAVVNWQQPVASDNCAVVSLNGTHQSGETFAVGTETVVYIVTDAAGRMDTCSFTVTVVDNEYPFIADLPSDITVNATPGLCGAVVSWPAPSASDNCGLDDFGSDIAPGSFFAVGDTTVNYIAIDINGNVTVASFTVTVVDNQVPVFNCPGDISLAIDGSVLNAPPGFFTTMQPVNCSNITLAFNTVAATDICGPVTVVQTAGLSSGSDFPVGNTLMTYVATDANGNTATCSFNINVLSPQPVTADFFPSLPCEGDDVFFFANGDPNAAYLWTDADGNTVSTESSFTLVGVSLDDVGEFTVYAALPYCDQEASVDLAVANLPNLTADANDLLCSDGSVPLMLTATDADNTGVIEWIWQFPNGATVFGQNQTVVSPEIGEDDGTYLVTAINANGCAASASVEVEISANPTQPSLNGTTANTCLGTEYTLFGQLFTGTNVTYNWFSTPVADSGLPAIVTGPVVSVLPTAEGVYTYHYFVVVDGCVSDTATWTVDVEDAPNTVISLIGETLCVDGTTAVILNETGGEATSWQWSGPAGPLSSLDSSVVLTNVTTATSGVYSVTAESDNGCATTVSIPVTITMPPSQAPQLVASQMSICDGASVTLTGTPYGSGTTYVWTGANLPPFSQNLSTVTVTPDQVGSNVYTFAALVNGCSTDTISLSILMENSPPVDITVVGNTACLDGNSPVILRSNATGATAWTWTDEDGTVLSTADSLVLTNATATSSGTYSVLASTSIGCSSSGAIDLVLTNALPEVSASLLDRACEDGTLAFSVTGVDGATYEWLTPQGNLFSMVQTPTILDASAVNNGTYSVIVSKDFCKDTATVDVDVLTAPTANSEEVVGIVNVPQGFNVVVNDVLAAGEAYTITVLQQPLHGTVVYNGDGVLTYSPERDFRETDNMIYEICYADCPDLCDIANVTLYVQFPSDSCVVTTVITPNSDDINDEFVVSCLDGGTYPLNTLQVFNQWGDLVYDAAPYENNWQGTYNGRDLPDGTYFYIFQRDPDLPAEKGFVMIYR